MELNRLHAAVLRINDGLVLIAHGASPARANRLYDRSIAACRQSISLLELLRGACSDAELGAEYRAALTFARRLEGILLSRLSALRSTQRAVPLLVRARQSNVRPRSAAPPKGAFDTSGEAAERKESTVAVLASEVGPSVTRSKIDALNRSDRTAEKSASDFVDARVVGDEAA